MTPSEAPRRLCLRHRGLVAGRGLFPRSCDACLEELLARPERVEDELKVGVMRDSELWWAEEAGLP